MGDKLWGGRFTSDSHKMMNTFHSSLRFDKRLWKEDIETSMAYNRMLAKQGILKNDEAAVIVDALKEIHDEIEGGTFTFDESLEDIHTHIENALVQRIGPLGEVLHT